MVPKNAEDAQVEDETVAGELPEHKLLYKEKLASDPDLYVRRLDKKELKTMSKLDPRALSPALVERMKLKQMWELPEPEEDGFLAARKIMQSSSIAEL